MSAEIIIGVGGLLVAFAGLCVTIWKVRREDLKDIDKRIESNTIALAAFKIQVAERHPTVGDLAEAERRFIEANRETLAAINRLSDRIDRLIEQRK